ncbi:MFS transporter [Aminobacter sp. HY435]|uniref:MFS transporter n=1 Tax=Aminobacter sp. HY435 TaxID=2970917 RepID=UPI0022B9AF34|nr:MFS transporter [Aminobacter sp. HY435]
MLFVVAGCAGLYLPNLPAIFASRLALGVAVALIMTAQTALIGDYFSGDDRNALTGLQISARNFGGLAFISLAGWMATLSPRLPFAIYGLAAAFLPLIWKIIVDPPRRVRARPANPAGAAGASWILPLAFLVLLQALTNMIFFIMPTQISFFLEASGYDSAIMTGSVLGTLMLSGGVLALAYPRIQRATGYAGIFLLGYAAMAVGFASLGYADQTLPLLAAAAMIGAGYALVSPSFVGLALNLAPASRRELGGGVLTASIFIGQFCSPLASTPLTTSHGYDGLFAAAAALAGSMAIASAMAGFAIWLRSRSTGNAAGLGQPR